VNRVGAVLSAAILSTLDTGLEEIRTPCDRVVADVVTAEELATHVVEDGDQVRR
jgi:hypothetical protein